MKVIGVREFKRGKVAKRHTLGSSYISLLSSARYVPSLDHQTLQPAMETQERTNLTHVCAAGWRKWD